MARGRPRIDPELHRLRGNPGKRRLPKPKQPQKAAAETGIAVPEPPEVRRFLGNRPGATEIYRRIMGEKLAQHIAQPGDALQYARWAWYMNRWIEMIEMMDGANNPGFYRTETGFWRDFPTESILRECEANLTKLERELGLTPLARQNIIRGMASLPVDIPGGLFDAREKEPAAEDDLGPEGDYMLKGAAPAKRTGDRYN